MELPQRKDHRLAGYDYSSPGGYFITICTKDKRNLFWASNQLVNDHPILTPTGKIVLRCIQSIPALHPEIQLSLFNIMPNHIHLILEIHAQSYLHSPHHRTNEAQRIHASWFSHLAKKLL